MFSDPTCSTLFPYTTLFRSYKLTPAELRVLLAVVEIGGAPEVAEALGIAETTVKFHLKRLFEKTGTRRQADLVKVVARSEEHTSELQSRENLVCRLLLEKKN